MGSNRPANLRSTGSTGAPISCTRPSASRRAHGGRRLTAEAPLLTRPPQHQLLQPPASVPTQQDSVYRQPCQTRARSASWCRHVRSSVVVPQASLSDSAAEGAGAAARTLPPPHLAEAEGTTAAAAGSLAAAEVEEAAADNAALLGSAQPTSAGTEQPATQAPAQGASLLRRQEVAEMLGFAVPALGMVLADPLMSLIDTACVGRISSLQLAALGPNTAVFNFCFQLFAFLGVGTTNLIASNSLRDASVDRSTWQARREVAERTLCNSLQLAAAFGTLATAVLLACGRTFLAGMGTAPELLQPAWQYLSIRALAAPAVLVMAVSQGACLGQQDAWTPFKVLLAVGLLNTVGDIFLISQCGMGVAGAAAATTAAQVLGAAYFVWYLKRKGSQPNGIRLRWTGLPRAAQMREFLTIAATLFTRTIFGMAAYFSMTTSATQLGTLATATHQIAMQTFWFLSYFPEPLSLAAQSLLARDRGRPEQSSYWAWLLLRSGAVLAVLLAAAVGGVFAGGAWLFTGDTAVQVAVRQLAPISMLAIAVCSVMMMFDGISVGSGSFSHLPPSNIAGLGVTLAVLHFGRAARLGLSAVWWALVAFYATRLSGHLLHYWRCKGGVFAAGGN